MTTRCLRSIESQMDEATNSVQEVIVVDNASSDGTVAAVRNEFPWVRLMSNQENAGFARANNQAIAASRSELVLLLNSDTEVQPGALSELEAFMNQHPRAAAAGAMLLNEDGSLQESCRPMLTPARELWRLLYLDPLWPRASYRMRSWDNRAPRRVEVMMGACMMLRRSALEEVGMLDEQFFMYTEEVDLCYRLLQQNWELWYVPSAKVLHYGQASSRQASEKMFVELYRSKVQFYRKVGGDRMAGRFKLMLRLAYWPRLLATGILAPMSQRSAQKARSYATLLRELAVMR